MKTFLHEVAEDLYARYGEGLSEAITVTVSVRTVSTVKTIANSFFIFFFPFFKRISLA